MQEFKIRELCSALNIPVTHVNADGWVMMCCPLASKTHKRGVDRNPSFGIRVNDEGKSGYHCFSCKSAGNLRDLVGAVEWARDLPYGEYSELANKTEHGELFHTPKPFDSVSVEDEEPVPLPMEIYEDLYPKATAIPEAVEYLLNRDIDRATSDRLGLLFDDEENRILFPIKDDTNVLYGYTGRLIFEHKYAPKIRNYEGVKKEKFILGEEHYQAGLPIVIVEGLFAYAHLHAVGLTATHNVMATMGSSLSDDQASVLFMWGEPVYILYDNDLAGEIGLFGKYREEKQDFSGGGAVDKLKDEIPTFIVPWIDGKDDPDQLSLVEVSRMLKHAEKA